MPIYSYRCDDCGHKFELLLGVTADSAERKCTKCGSQKVKKTWASFSVGSSTPEPSSCSTGTCKPVKCPTC